MSFTKAGLKVLGYGYDRNFGGRNFDEVRSLAPCSSMREREHR